MALWRRSTNEDETLELRLREVIRGSLFGFQSFNERRQIILPHQQQKDTWLWATTSSRLTGVLIVKLYRHYQHNFLKWSWEALLCPLLMYIYSPYWCIIICPPIHEKSDFIAQGRSLYCAKLKVVGRGFQFCLLVWRPLRWCHVQVACSDDVTKSGCQNDAGCHGGAVDGGMVGVLFLGGENIDIGAG